MNTPLTAHSFYVADLADDLTFTNHTSEIAATLRGLGKEGLLLSGIVRGIYYREDDEGFLEAHYVTTPDPKSSTRVYDLL